jgi:hypothetical protein
VTVLGSGAKAAAACKASRDGGYSDWFLLSIGQIDVLFLKKGSLYNASGSFGSDYWSSTEVSGNVSWAVILTFQYGSHFSEVKTISHSVRPMRAF